MSIPVWVVFRADRGVYTLRWNDPRTGKRCQRRAKAINRKDAYKEAGLLQDELAQTGGQLRQSSKANPTWDEFNSRFVKSRLASASRKHGYKWSGIVKVVDEEFTARRIEIPLLSDVTTEFLESVQQRLVDKGNRAATVQSSMDTLMTGLNWAAKLKLMAPVLPPEVGGREMQLDSEVHGRPLTTEEFERISDQIRKVKKIATYEESWRLLLRGLWLSGLRLGEILNLHQYASGFHRPVNLHTKRPAIAFVAAKNKNRKDQQVAIAPEFAELLRSIEPIDGFYFNPTGKRGRYKTGNSVGVIVSKFGELAGVIVGTTERIDESGNVQAENVFATAHDFRRTFARRWSSRVMPPILQHLMRHKSIETTLKFYVGSSADSAAVSIREGWERSGAEVPADIFSDKSLAELNR